MQPIQQIARQIVDREGGYVNHPNDPGGATKHGVTLKTLQRLGLDLTEDQRIDVSDVRAVTPEIAAELFITRYYAEPRVNALPEVLQPSVFDMYVNAGAAAVRILQRLLNDMRITVTVDGVIGPQTARAAKAAVEAAPDHIVDAYGIARRNYYYRLADKKPPLRDFARAMNGGKGGWIKRAEEFMSPKYHLTEAEHAARVAQWV